VSNTTDNQGESARNAKYSTLRLSNLTAFRVSKYRTTTTSLLGGLAIERNTYSTDMSSSHMLDSISPVIGIGIEFTKNTYADLTYRHSLATKFGYNQNKSFRSEKVSGSKARVSELAFELTQKLSNRANFN